jgi:type II secretory pathway pseudopilin PulG
MIKKTSKKHPNDSSGFTIVELMISTIVFSVIMLLVAGAVVRFTANFQRGTTQTTTQNVARSVMDEVSQSLQFSTGYAELTPNGYYVNPQQYSYALGKQIVSDGNHALVSRPASSPGNPQDLSAGVSADSKELLIPGMRLARFDIDQRGMLFSITVRVVYGDADLLCVEGSTSGGAADCNSTDPMNDEGVLALSKEDKGKLQCKAQKGSQYCAVSELSTTVQRRIQ